MGVRGEHLECDLGQGKEEGEMDKTKQSWTYTRWLIQTDLHRHLGRHGWWLTLTTGYGIPGFRCTLWFRVCHYLRQHRDWRMALFVLARWVYFRNLYKFGISIPYDAKIGPGLYIGHFGGIFVSSHCILGQNVNLSQDITLGGTVRDGVRQAATLGDNVYIGPGVKTIGPVTIGSHAAVGANCVVTKDVPDHAIVAGVPGKILSVGKGSQDYINHTDYTEFTPAS